MNDGRVVVVPGARDRLIAARLVMDRTPPARLHAQYRNDADFYVDAHRFQPPILRLIDGSETAARLGFRRSLVFGRDYLVAWVDDNEAFNRAMPVTDAIVSPISIPWTPVPFPLVVAPERRRRSRSQSFTSIIEHEIVHVNQSILGFCIPEFTATSLPELLRGFFTYTHLEYEAHFVQLSRWPPRLRLETAPTFEQWVLLRAYTPAIEQIFREAARGRIPERIVPRFLDAVRKGARVRLRSIGCGPDLVAWFLTRWAVDVYAALQVLGSQGVDVRCPPLRVVWNWLKIQPEFQRQRESRDHAAGPR